MRGCPFLRGLFIEGLCNSYVHVHVHVHVYLHVIVIFVYYCYYYCGVVVFGIYISISICVNFVAFMAEHHRMGGSVAGLAQCFKQEDKEC